jgi:hypothetical protein
MAAVHRLPASTWFAYRRNARNVEQMQNVIAPGRAELRPRLVSRIAQEFA